MVTVFAAIARGTLAAVAASRGGAGAAVLAGVLVAAGCMVTVFAAVASGALALFSGFDILEATARPAKEILAGNFGSGFWLKIGNGVLLETGGGLWCAEVRGIV